MNDIEFLEKLSFKTVRDVNDKHIFFKTHNSLIYHYTQINVFWRIIEDQTFRAGHIRFSNDINEYVTGKNYLSDIANDSELMTNNEHKDIYIVCFCQRGDSLSQWRGYSPDSTGVSIGFDFSVGLYNDSLKQTSKLHCFSMKKQKHLVKNCNEIDKLDNLLRLDLTSPYRVIYPDGPDKDKTSEYLKGNKTDKEEIKDSVNYVKVEYDKSAHIEDFIPYIKDHSFREEEEYRLVFDLTNKEKDINIPNFIHYIENDTLKKPGIIVSMIDPDRKKENCKIIRIVEKNKKYETINIDNIFIDNVEINEEHIFNKLNEKIQNHNLKNDCTLHFHIGEGNNQKAIFDVIESYIKIIKEKFPDNNSKIWCDGYLPIRKIYVATGKDTIMTYESIQNYISKYYWLKFIEVEKSKIPYREKHKS